MEMREGAVRLVCLCEMERVMEDVITEGRRRHFPLCLRKVCCVIIPWFPVGGCRWDLNENVLLHHVFCTYTLQPSAASVYVSIHKMSYCIDPNNKISQCLIRKVMLAHTEVKQLH